MNWFSLRGKVLPLAALLLFVAGCARGKPRLNDNGDLFKPVTRAQALKKLEEINHQYHAFVVIDTFHKVPLYKDPLRRVPKMEPADEEAFFQKWAKKRVPASTAIYILAYTGEPAPNVQVAVGREITAKKAFTPENRAELSKMLSSSLTSEDSATGLLAGIQFINDRLDANLDGPVTPKPFDWIGFGIIVLVLAGVWLGAALLQTLGKSQTYRVGFAGVNLAGYELAGGLLGLATVMRTARVRVDAKPPPPPPLHEDKIVDEDMPADTHGEPVAAPRDEEVAAETPPEPAAAPEDEPHAAAPAEPETGDETPRA